MQDANNQRPVVERQANAHCVTFYSSSTIVNLAGEKATEIFYVALAAAFGVNN